MNIPPNTQWSDRAEHPSGYYYLPTGYRWDRAVRGQIVTVTRQIPPGLQVGVNTPDHPNSLAWCLFIDGKFTLTIGGIFNCFGCLAQVLYKIELLLNAPDDAMLPPFNYPRIELHE